MRPPRILFVYQFLTLGGVEVVMQTRLRELASRDIEARMLFLAESGGGESIFNQMGDQVAVHTEEAEIEKYVRDFNPDWISTIDTPGIIPIARRVVPDARIAYEVHTPYPDYVALLLDPDLMARVSGIIVPSQSQKEFIALRIARPLPIEVVPNSLPKEFLNKTESNPPKSNIVMWVGRLDDLKNWRGFIQLAARVRESIEAEFWIVGGLRNREEGNLFEAIQKAGLMDSFRWLPAVSYEDMPRLYDYVGRSGGCLVSTSWAESFGMAALEAMASGCPVIAPDIVGLRDLVKHGETGWLYPSMNNDRASDFVLEAIQDSGARETIIKNAEREARDFTPAATIDRLLEVFSEWSANPAPYSEPASLDREGLLDQLSRHAELQGVRIAEREALIDSLSRELRRDDAAQRVLMGEQMLNQLSAQLTDTQKLIDARDNGIRWLSAQIANMERIVRTRDEAVDWLRAKLTEQERKTAHKEETADNLRAELANAERTLSVRDDAITWLRSEVNESKRKSEHLTAVNESLTARSKQLESAINKLSAELVDHQERIAALSAELNNRQQLADALSAELNNRQELATALDARLTATEEALQLHAEEINRQEEILRERNEGIAWLKGELEESTRKSQRLIGSNNFLKMQLAKNEAAINGLEQQLATTQLELEKITRSLGWRLLSRYGRIKYRYLLPLYRQLNLLPTEARLSTRNAATLAPGMTVDESASNRAEGLTMDAQEIAGPAFQETDGSEAWPNQQDASEESQQFDFYKAVTLLPHVRREEIEAVLDKRPPAEPLHRQDVVCFSIIDWEFRYQRPQQIMSQFASHGHRVFYISTTRFLPADAAPRVLVKRIKKNVYEVQLAAVRMPDVYGEVIDGDNRQALLDSLDELRRTHRINDAIAYTMIASWGAVALEAKRMWGWRNIYDCMDEWENFPGISPDILDMERRLVRQCDLLVVTAQRLWEKWESDEQPMVLARNGVDIDFYGRHYGPNGILAGVEHPIIGYFGALADWFDVQLVVHAAKARPDYAFVLLGGVFNLDVSELESLPNVLLLGQRPYETMPQYLYHFDVCMIPFKINPITEATDPVKLYEYLSAGKPVVSVALSEVELYSEYIYIARDRDEFVAQLDAAVAEDDRDMIMRRRKFAEQHSWRQRYEIIEAGVSRITPRASIIIVTFNNLVLSKLCLESVIRNTEYLNYEIVVVDNDSKDGTPAYLRYMAAQYPNISIILNDANQGFARANNQGVARSNGDFVVLLNNDTIVPPGWLNRLLRHLENESVGLVGPVTNFVGNEAKIKVDYHTWGEMEEFAARYTWEHDGQSADIYMLAMFCVAFRRDTYDEIGPLDERFGLGMFEDDDYTQRVKAKGYRVMCAADVFVHHFGQAAFKKLIENGTYNPLFDENRSYYETKWNVTWTPHKHSPLKFERLTHPHSGRRTIEKERQSHS
jgi:GT2 family glycosyltransferase/glycosyltransferase involved in cell wall biosynthesis